MLFRASETDPMPQNASKKTKFLRSNPLSANNLMIGSVRLSLLPKYLIVDSYHLYFILKPDLLKTFCFSAIIICFNNRRLKHFFCLQIYNNSIEFSQFLPRYFEYWLILQKFYILLSAIPALQTWGCFTEELVISSW